MEDDFDVLRHLTVADELPHREEGAQVGVVVAEHYLQQSENGGVMVQLWLARAATTPLHSVPHL